MAAAEFSLGVLLIAGALANFLDLHFVMGKLFRSNHRRGRGSHSASLFAAAERNILLEELWCDYCESKPSRQEHTESTQITADLCGGRCRRRATSCAVVFLSCARIENPKNFPSRSKNDCR